jgi:hypothetical protein
MASKHVVANSLAPAQDHSKGVPEGWVSATTGMRPTPPATATAKSWKQRLLSWQVLAGVAVVLLAAQGVGLLVVKHSGGDVAPKLGRTVPLGRFEFTRPAARDKSACHGQFDVSVELADGLTTVQRRQVTEAVPGLQQAVEEVLHRARVADFADSRLFRLRNQMLARLNDALGFDGIAEVNVANFHLDAP